jgi:hypothetical protein
MTWCSENSTFPGFVLGSSAIHRVAQRAIVTVLEAIYEQDFLPCSYGFRPRRSAHMALRELHGAITWRKQNWVLDVDSTRSTAGVPRTTSNGWRDSTDDRQVAQGQESWKTDCSA